MHLFVDSLTNVDFSYLHHTRGVVGETWLANAALDGALDHQGMVCDFGIVKKTLRNWLDHELDHRLLVPTRSPHLSMQQDGEQIQLTWALPDGEHITVGGPAQAFALVAVESITPESVAAWCVNELDGIFPTSVDKLSLSFSVESIDSPFYHYSHGLKKHDGNCQRIAHGHRSRIRIDIDSERSPALESQWAERWADIYLGTREDLTGEDTQGQTTQLHFAYKAQQGDFTLTIPANRCEILDCDTTVEQLAQYIADVLAAENAGKQITVRAYEGIGKGAVAFAGR
ncbi:6-carboxytetrahydropterin synthase [Microbulbifer agarilyticus]|uniref:6-carboxytetrahydropterin synthase n=1 Tax=Microbulbifer agarilyticus TaxID=260552 RepID=UPI001CD5CCBA|nr:6-carboxytetrahydropterin synthase [Microbulbifer agarilyticus]MCA0895044.1 6-carboxytetrahydropterin synthase [Microbulbifer agarilyticus]